MKFYMGFSDFSDRGEGVKVDVYENLPRGRRNFLGQLKHIVFHSPTGYGWGYGGSGPADLALSILSDHFKEIPTRAEIYSGKSKAQLAGYQDFKWQFIATLDQHQSWEITSEEIDIWLRGREFAAATEQGVLGNV